MKRHLFLIAIIFLLSLSTVNVFGQSSRRRINKPKTQIFLEGGNDSWNTRQKPGKKRKAVKKVKRARTNNTRTINQRRTNSQTNILPYIEQQNINKKPVANGVGGSGNNQRTNGQRARKKYANQETGYRKKQKRRF